MTAGLVSAPTRSAAKTIAAGVGIGLALGIALRAWMRLVSTAPEFSWSGTGFIVGVFALLGLSAGVATATRHRTNKWVHIAIRAVGVGLGLGCFFGAGAGMLATVSAGALAYARTDWARWLRVALAALAAVAAVALVLGLVELSWPRRIVALIAFLPLCWVEISLFARLATPTLPQHTFPKVLRVAATVAAVLAVLAGGVALTGLAGGE